MKKVKWKLILGIVGCIILCIVTLTPTIKEFVQKQGLDAKLHEANDFFSKNCEAVEETYQVKYKECDIYAEHKATENNEDVTVIKTITFDEKKELDRQKILNLCIDISNMSKHPFVIDTQTANRTVFVVGYNKYMLSNNTDINKATNLNSYYILIKGGKEITNNFDSLTESEKGKIESYNEKVKRDAEEKRKEEAVRKEKEEKTKKLMEENKKKSQETEQTESDEEESKDILYDGFTLVDGYEGTKAIIEYGYAEITGTVKNETGVSWDYVEIDFDIYNSSGEKVGVAMDNIRGLDANERWKFKALCACDENQYRYSLKGIYAY